MLLTQLPGFSNPVHHAQLTFRALLDALAMPGKIQQIPFPLTAPGGLDAATAAAGLTLFDRDTPIWLQPGGGEEVSGWLQFHTGCQFTPDPQAAHFALVRDGKTMPPLTTFQTGSPEQPELSTTLLIQVEALQGGSLVLLTGPGIQDSRLLEIQGLPTQFWQEWHRNTQAYPLGVDLLLICQTELVGIPRTTHARSH
jgi:alpha-D-ribose 1-methylphosphonate 5-triphosphate synthase subunit PhnH